MSINLPRPQVPPAPPTAVGTFSSTQYRLITTASANMVLDPRTQEVRDEVLQERSADQNTATPEGAIDVASDGSKDTPEQNGSASEAGEAVSFTEKHRREVMRVWDRHFEEMEKALEAKDAQLKAARSEHESTLGLLEAKRAEWASLLKSNADLAQENESLQKRLKAAEDDQKVKNLVARITARDEQLVSTTKRQQEAEAEARRAKASEASLKAALDNQNGQIEAQNRELKRLSEIVQKNESIINMIGRLVQHKTSGDEPLPTLEQLVGQDASSGSASTRVETPPPSFDSLDGATVKSPSSPSIPQSSVPAVDPSPPTLASGTSPETKSTAVEPTSPPASLPSPKTESIHSSPPDQVLSGEANATKENVATGSPPSVPRSQSLLEAPSLNGKNSPSTRRSQKQRRGGYKAPNVSSSWVKTPTPAPAKNSVPAPAKVSTSTPNAWQMADIAAADRATTAENRKNQEQQIEMLARQNKELSDAQAITRDTWRPTTLDANGKRVKGSADISAPATGVSNDQPLEKAEASTDGKTTTSAAPVEKLPSEGTSKDFGKTVSTPDEIKPASDEASAPAAVEDELPKTKSLASSPPRENDTRAGSDQASNAKLGELESVGEEETVSVSELTTRTEPVETKATVDQLVEEVGSPPALSDETKKAQTEDPAPLRPTSTKSWSSVLATDTPITTTSSTMSIGSVPVAGYVSVEDMGGEVYKPKDTTINKLKQRRQEQTKDTESPPAAANVQLTGGDVGSKGAWIQQRQNRNEQQHSTLQESQQTEENPQSVDSDGGGWKTVPPKYNPAKAHAKHTIGNGKVHQNPNFVRWTHRNQQPYFPTTPASEKKARDPLPIPRNQPGNALSYASAAKSKPIASSWRTPVPRELTKDAVSEMESPATEVGERSPAASKDQDGKQHEKSETAALEVSPAMNEGAVASHGQDLVQEPTKSAKKRNKNKKKKAAGAASTTTGTAPTDNVDLTHTNQTKQETTTAPEAKQTTAYVSEVKATAAENATDDKILSTAPVPASSDAKTPVTASSQTASNEKTVPDLMVPDNKNEKPAAAPLKKRLSFKEKVTEAKDIKARLTPPATPQASSGGTWVCSGTTFAEKLKKGMEEGHKNAGTKAASDKVASDKGGLPDVATETASGREKTGSAKSEAGTTGEKSQQTKTEAQAGKPSPSNWAPLPHFDNHKGPLMRWADEVDD